MLLSFVPLVLTPVLFLTVLCSRFDWSVNNGKTRLRGNSFGSAYVNTTYDYVIVGGGTAGLTIASRLAAAPNVTVAVVEAGSFYEFGSGNTSQVPGYGSTYLAFKTLAKNYQPTDWDLITANQSGFNDRQIHYTAGKTLGGSSALNDLIFHRGTKGSFQWWADVVGDNSYTWDNFLPWLKKSVAFSPPNRAKISTNVSISYDPAAWSSEGGPLHVSYPNYRQPFDPYMEKALAKSGLHEIEGLNSGVLDGYAAGTYTIDPRAEVRSSSEESFLQDAMDTTPLKVYTDSLVHKVLFNNEKAATGVLVETDEGLYTLSARKEVVVSSGVFHSPQVLMLSGIGPASQLQAHGIPVVSDLHGVGNNMIDQTFIFTIHQLNITTNSGVLTNPALHAAAVDTYLNEQNGPLTGVGGDIIGWEKIPDRKAFTSAALEELDSLPSDWAEAEYLGLSAGANPDDQPMANNYQFLTAAIFAPFSKGYVNISSSNPNDPPIINPNSLSSPTESELAVQALKRMRQFAAASGVEAAETEPGPDVVTDAQILEWIRDNSVNGYHAACSCRMGKASDPDAVIDSRARVYGVSGLRVVDASAFAILPPGHPMSTIYALAEKIADDMLSS